MILALKTDHDPVEIYLLASDGTIIRQKKWPAERTLAKSLLGEIEQLLAAGTPKAAWSDLRGVIVFRGPGSFTGLRIGVTTANTLAYALAIPIVGTTGRGWLKHGLTSLAAGQNDQIVLPHYGAPPHITRPKK